MADVKEVGARPEREARLKRVGVGSSGRVLGISKIATFPSPLGIEAAVVILPHKQMVCCKVAVPFLVARSEADCSVLRSSPRPLWSIPGCTVNTHRGLHGQGCGLPLGHTDREVDTPGFGPAGGSYTLGCAQFWCHRRCGAGR